MVRIGAAGNTATASLQLLIDKGYRLGVIYDDNCTHYIARKDENVYSAENPLELLGLVALGETWGDEWMNKGLRDGVDSVWEKLEETD